MKKAYRFTLLNIILFGSLLLSACATRGNSLDGTNWELASYQDANGDTVNKITDTVVTAQFQAEKVSGKAGCNNYNSSYQVDGKKLAFTLPASTRKMCADPAGIMEQEDAYLVALVQVQTFKQSDDTLEMQNAHGDTILVFIHAGQ